NIENNVASSQGGGIWNGKQGALTLNNVIIKDNKGMYGAGVYSYTAFTMNGGEVSGNGSDNNSSGGGFFITNDPNQNAPFILNDVVIKNNYSNYGGGFYVTEGAKTTINDGEIKGNIASNNSTQHNYG